MANGERAIPVIEPNFSGVQSIMDDNIKNATQQMDHLSMDRLNLLAEDSSHNGNRTDFYRITKTNSQNSVEHCCLDNLLESQEGCSSSNKKLTSVNGNRCANRKEKTKLGPKNSLSLDESTKNKGEEVSAVDLLFNGVNIRRNSVICKKTVNDIENLANIAHSQNEECSAGISVLGWQATCRNARERLSYMLMNDKLADVYFLFREPDGNFQKIPAHKFILSIGSAVFEAMFRFNDSSAGGCVNCIRVCL